MKLSLPMAVGHTELSFGAYARLLPLLNAVLATIAIVISLAITGCSVKLVADPDKDSIERITDISKSTLKFYQDLMAVETAKRPSAMDGLLGKSQGDVDSKIRLHLLREQARDGNGDSAHIAQNLLDSWGQFTMSHVSGNSKVFSDAQLDVERRVIERQLRSAFAAEEIKKTGSNAVASVQK